VRYELRGQPAVTLVIPSGGKMKFLQPCLESVLERSTYPNLQVLVTDNSDGTAVADHCQALARRDPRLKYRRFRVEPFNYSAINNSALSVVDTPYVVFLNDDITVIAPDWVEAMLEHAQRPEVGVVGAKLLYPDRSLQHAGVTMGLHGNCGHAFKHFGEDDPGYFCLPHLIRNCSAVTFACAMMRRSVFEEVGGFDAQNLAVACNDVDICLRARERGYRVVYTPYAVLIHHESVTKKVFAYPGEEEYMQRRWRDVIRHDPFYNPNLTREAEDYSLNFDAPTVAERLGLFADRDCSIGEAPCDPCTPRSERGRAEKAVEDPGTAVALHAVAASSAALEGVNGHRPRRKSYTQVRRLIREAVNASVPPDTVVVVVSRGDDTLLQLGPRRAWHFPQTEDGVYAGCYPADSQEAIAHLEGLRRNGGDYLLFPSTAFWWLGFYGDFQKHLESHYSRIWSDPNCLIFQLSSTPGGHDLRG
jgi:GT2 family glycosyltransferase